MAARGLTGALVRRVTSLDADSRAPDKEPKWEASVSRTDAVTGRSFGEDVGARITVWMREAAFIYHLMNREVATIVLQLTWLITTSSIA